MNFPSAPSYSVSSAQLEHKSGAEAFWLAAAGLTGRLAVAPGFIRRFTFADGPHFTLIALWRTPADAEEFFSSDEHQAAMRQLFRDRWQYSHFAALWKMITPRQRVILCQQCDGVTPATDKVCVGCGTELFDPFAVARPLAEAQYRDADPSGRTTPVRVSSS